ncbi:MAG TPA: CARDB domain-containing protein [Candidatus Moranbacteria bacterium]|nr:CARDB domain-containing protein [Candidatus Moranbacteria bacterium]
MSTNSDQNDKKTELPEKNGNLQKIIIAVLVVAVAVLAGSLFGVMKKNAVKDEKADSKIDAKESVLEQNAGDISGKVTSSEENIATDENASDSTSSSESSETSKYPDLYVEKYSFSEDPKSGEEFTVNIKIGNKGNADAKSFHWDWYATAHEKNCDGKVNSLAAGKTVTVGCKFTYSSWAAYETKAVIDPESEIYESNESNNTAAKQVIPIHDEAKADLYISSYAFNHAPKQAESFSVGITIKNGGTAAAGAFWWEWWPTDFGKACRAQISGLAANAQKTVFCSYTYSSWSTYATKAVTDADNNISESNESNNTHTESVIPIH